ncbi:TetR/AcrR family transcriptional regulator (plasmid) [Streptomyces sp. NBC_01340]|uniref:TetR/AcrR family transcriptional regulator n=1 Tax=unclassified Streptomyces TaxID=2593676 RepID=UPI00224E6D3D|nr:MULTISPECIES: TetR/AcrR family transcriptional regulator [unclassified Streptomyces]MCX4461009.1 TetR/AcrR family transcriptional regulator [Streptomyces sp. NBC_01719]MCX4499662.1 TetR/AcrR family transcriptional regulator [Streptomyces sp. NBC_01728]WSI44819.1 TetR/AcrR family transcriptional regulator [Streptomyces sp. NBC_01340]
MTTRKYHSPRRTDSAAATREAVLSSAHALFLARGYPGVTIGEIAEAAKVAVPTVYTSVGNKPSILTALLEPALTDPAIADNLAAIEASDDPRTVIELTAEGTRLTHERHWDLVYGLFYRNPPGEPAVKAVLDRGADDYVQALTRVADHLVTLDALGADVSRTEAVDVLWFHLGPHAWMTLVGERAWPFDRAQAWIARSACQALLKDYR